MSYYENVIREINWKHENGHVDNRAWDLSKREEFEDLINAISGIVDDDTRDDIYNEAYEDGYETGNNDGYREGVRESDDKYDQGYEDGFEAGKKEGV